jgi:hypothetical protein
MKPHTADRRSSNPVRLDTRPSPSASRFFDERDLRDENPVFAGGSDVVVQKYLHDLDASNALPVESRSVRRSPQAHQHLARRPVIGPVLDGRPPPGR